MIRNHTIAARTMAIASSMLAFSMLAGTQALGAERNDIRMSCYDIIGERPKPAQRELFVLVDQTLVASRTATPSQINLALDVIKAHAIDQVRRFLRHGDKVSVLSFSAYDRFHNFTRREFVGHIDTPRKLAPEQRRKMAVGKGKRFERCFAAQLEYARDAVGKAMAKAFSSEGRQFTNTAVIGALKNVAEEMIAKSQAPEKVLLLASDLVENDKEIKMAEWATDPGKVDAREQLKRLARGHMIPNLAGTRVYVIGAAITLEKLRPTGFLSTHKEFWRLFFKTANASLDGYGEPVLLADMR